MKNLFTILVSICLLGITLGVFATGPGFIPALLLAAGAVSFILAFIVKVVDKAETDDLKAKHP